MSQKITLYEKADYSWYRTWDSLCPSNGFRTASISDLPLAALPITFVSKGHAVCMVNSGDTLSHSYLMVDFHLKDRRVFDRHPLVFRFDHEHRTAVAGFVDHLQDGGRRSFYDPTVTSGLIAVTSGSGLISCGSGYWFISTEGNFTSLAANMPREAHAFHCSVSMLDKLTKTRRAGSREES